MVEWTRIAQDGSGWLRIGHDWPGLTNIVKIDWESLRIDQDRS